jgi:hypothetical protein
VARHDSSSTADLADAAANPIRIELRAAIDVLATTEDGRASRNPSAGPA